MWERAASPNEKEGCSGGVGGGGSVGPFGKRRGGGFCIRVSIKRKKGPHFGLRGTGRRRAGRSSITALLY